MQFPRRYGSTPRQICLAERWEAWGYSAEITVGHSIGELTAAYQAGLLSLEEVILLTQKIGRIASKVDGKMAHGFIKDEEIAELGIGLSSKNFVVDDKVHVTVSGSREEIDLFLENRHDFVSMRPHHPWHHRSYEGLAADLKT